MVNLIFNTMGPILWNEIDERFKIHQLPIHLKENYPCVSSSSIKFYSYCYILVFLLFIIFLLYYGKHVNF